MTGRIFRLLLARNRLHIAITTMARTRRPQALLAPFLQGFEILPERVDDWAVHPFHLGFVKDLRLDFTTPVTFFLGENGSGKTTLLEAIADLCRLPMAGGGPTEMADNLSGERPHSSLARALRPSFRKTPRGGYFVRAENLVRLADLLDQRKRDPDFLGDPHALYGGRSLHTRSHGEAFLALFAERLAPGGMLLMDEPEAALSPQKQLTLLAQLYDFSQRGDTQIIIATHSPLLMTFPGARLLELDRETVQETTLERTSHYQITRGMLEAPERYWKHLKEVETD